MIANPWVRPYVLTGGRTQTRKHPYLHTLVSVDRYDESASARLLPRRGGSTNAPPSAPSRSRSSPRTARCPSA